MNGREKFSVFYVNQQISSKQGEDTDLKKSSPDLVTAEDHGVMGSTQQIKPTKTHRTLTHRVTAYIAYP